MYEKLVLAWQGGLLLEKRPRLDENDFLEVMAHESCSPASVRSWA